MTRMWPRGNAGRPGCLRPQLREVSLGLHDHPQPRRLRGIRHYPFDGARQAIVPVGDLFNHSTTAPNVAAYDASLGYLQTGAYVYTALRPIAAGDELLVSYGAHDNATLLKHYGFVPRGPNPHDRVAVALGDVEDDGRLATDAAARAWLAEQGFESGHALTHDGPSFELLAALRLRHATDDEYRNGAAFAIAEGEAVSGANEARVWAPSATCARARAAADRGGGRPPADRRAAPEAKRRAGGGARAAGARVSRRARRAGRGERGARRARGARARGRGRCEAAPHPGQCKFLETNSVTRIRTKVIDLSRPGGLAA